MNGKQDQGSHLFMVRFWSEGLEGHKGWRGRVQHVLSGETRTFCDWTKLVELLLEMSETDRLDYEQPEVRGERRE